MRRLLLALVACVSACVPPAPRTATVDDLASETVALVRGERTYCSAVWLAEDLLVTAEHCVEELEAGSRVDYRSGPDAPGMPAFVTVKAPEHDLALLVTLDTPAHRSAGLALCARPGDPVQTMGHPMGLTWSYSAGHVAAVRKADAGLDIVWVQATAPVSPGSSGGGLFDVRGDLLGVTSRGLMRGQGLNLFVHAQYVRDLLMVAGRRVRMSGLECAR